MANRLMFEVGIKRANEEYQKIYDEVIKLAHAGDKPVNIRIALQETESLSKFLHTLTEFGSGKQLEPLIEKVAKLQARLSEMDNKGSYLDRVRADAKAAAEQLAIAEEQFRRFEKFGVGNQAIRENYRKNIEAARVENARAQEQLASAEKRFANELSDSQHKLKQDIDKTKSSLESLGTSPKIDTSGVDNLDNKLHKVIEDIGTVVSQAKKLTDTLIPQGGVSAEQVAGTKNLAQSLVELATAKEKAKGEESTLSSETRSTTTALSIEEEQAKKTTTAMMEASVAISAAAVAAKNLYTILGGNSSDVAKFMELANQMDILNRKASVIAQSDSTAFKGGKINALGEVQKEMKLVQEQMDELKKNTTVGSPIIDTFAAAIAKLSVVLSAAEQKIADAANKIGELNTSLSNFGNKQAANSIKEVGDAAEKAAQAQQQLNQAESKQVAQGGLFDPQKFVSLQDAIDKIISEINRLKEAFVSIGNIGSFKEFATKVNGLLIVVNSLVGALEKVNSALHIDKSAEEIAVFEKKIAELKTQYEQLQAQVTGTAAAAKEMNKDFKSIGDMKGSEASLNTNMQKLKDLVTSVKTEFDRLNDAYKGGRDMGMPMNADIERRLAELGRFLTELQELQQKASTAGTELNTLMQKAQAFKALFFDAEKGINTNGIGNLLFSKAHKDLYNSSQIDAYIKIIEKYVTTQGQAAQTTGAATSAVEKFTRTWDKFSKYQSRQHTPFSETAAGMRNFAQNIETARLAYDKTLRGISELESRISQGQKANMDAQTMEFMNGLKQRAQQWVTLLKDMLGKDLKGNNLYREFLSQSSSILTSPQMANGLNALLGSDWKILLKDIGSTFNMLMKSTGFSKELSVDNTTLSNWLKADEAVRRLQNSMKDLDAAWEKVGKKATPEIEERVAKQRQALESLISQFNGAKIDQNILSNRNGLSDLLGAGYKNAVGYDNTRLIQDIRAYGSEVDKTEKAEEKANQQAISSYEKRKEAESNADAKRQSEINRAWREREQQIQKEYQTKENARQKDIKAQQEADAKAAESANRAAEKKRAADERAAEARRVANEKATQQEVAGREAALKREQDAQLKWQKQRQLLMQQSVSDSKTNAEVEAYRMQGILDKLRGLRGHAIYAEADTTAIDSLIRKLEVLQRIYNSIAQGGGRDAVGRMFGDIKGEAHVREAYLDINNIMREYGSIARKNQKEVDRTIQLQQKLDAAMQKNYADLGIRQNDPGFKNIQAAMDELMVKIQKVRQDIDLYKAAIGSGNKESVNFGQKGLKEAEQEAEKLMRQYLALYTTLDRLRGGGNERPLLTDVRGSKELEMLNNAYRTGTSELQKQAKAEDEANKNKEKTADTLSKVEKKYEQLKGKMEEYDALSRKAGEAKLDTSSLDAQKTKLTELKNLLEQISRNRGLTDAGETYAQVMRKFGVEIQKTDREAKNLQKTLSKTTKGFSGDPIKDVNSELTKMLRLQGQLEKTERVMKGLDLDTQEIRNQINLIKTYIELLEKIKASGGTFNGQTVYSAKTQNPNLEAEAKAAMARGQLAVQTEKASHSVSNLTNEEQKLAQAIGHSNNEMKNQSQILSDLKMMAMQYLSVWGAQSFVNSIIETGGLLEQQRLSIGAILQNAGQATELFGQIKQLALKSPFGVVELDKMSKQLTAYGFEYKELFEWTKRLADISAATGTSVDRLALALGHVRAEGALSGYTLRQFAMGNVPLLRMLAENLNISTKQVREKVRKKDISYEDVMEVMKQLTDKGGMFYEAQETMSQALNAKFKNLRDAFDIMYNEIAESGVGESLKDLAVILTTGAKHWKELADVVLWTGSAFGIAKAAMLLHNQAIGAGTAATLKSAAADKQKEVNMLRLAKEYRALSAAEWQLLATHSHWYATSGKLTTAQLSLLLSEKKLNQEELLRAVALGKINKELALKAVLEMKAGTTAERHAKAELLWSLRGVQTLSKIRVAWIGIGNAIRTAGAALWSFSKVALPMAAFAGIVEMFARVSQMSKQAKEASVDLAEKATSDMKVLKETFKDLESNKYLSTTEKDSQYINGHRVVKMGITFDDDKIANEEHLTKEIEDLKGKLQDMSPMYEGDLIDIDKMENQVDQFKTIVKKLESIRHANDVTEAMSNVVTDANESVSGNHWWTKLFGDTYTTDVKDYEDTLNDVVKYVNKINEESIDKIDEELGGLLTNLQKKYSLDSKNSALSYLFITWSKNGLPSNVKKDGITKKMFDNAAGGWFGHDLRSQYRQLERDTKEMAEKMSSIVVNQFSDDPQGAVYAITSYMKKLMSMSSITDPQVMEEARRLMLEEMRKAFPANSKNGQLMNDVSRKMQVKILQEKFNEMLGSSITESSKPEEIEKAYNRAKEGANKWGEMMGYDMAKLGADAGKAYNEALAAKINSVKLKTDWQRRASKIFIENISIKSNFDKSLDEFVQAVQKDLKAKQDYLTRNKMHLKMILSVDTSVLMNVDKMKALMHSLLVKRNEKARKGDFAGASKINDMIENEIKPFYNALVAAEEDKKYLKSEGYPEKDPTKGNKSEKDKEAKELREYIRILNEAEKSYQYWRKTIGDAAAAMHVNTEFGDELKRVGDLLKAHKSLSKESFKFENEEQYEETLKKIKNIYDQIYEASTRNGKKRPQLLEALKEVDKTLADIARKTYEKNMEEYFSKNQTQLDRLTKAWERYKKLLESTGDEELSARVAFRDIDLDKSINYKFSEDDNLPAMLKKKLEADLARISKVLGAQAIRLKYDINMSETEIEKSVQDAFNAAKPAEPVRGKNESEKDFKARQSAYMLKLSDYESRIKSVTDALKAWKNAQIDAVQAGIEEFSKLIGGLKDYQTRIDQISAKAQLSRDALNAAYVEYLTSGGTRGINSEDYGKAINVVNTNEEYDKWKESIQYIQLMNNSLSLGRKEIENGINVALQKELMLLKQNIISADEYAERCAKIRDIQSEWNQQSIFGANNSITAYIRGGESGLRNWLKDDIKRNRAIENRKDTSEEERKAAANRAFRSDKQFKALDDLEKTVGGVSATFDALASSLQPLIDIFDQLGMEDVGNVVSGVQGAMSGAMQGGMAGIALSPLLGSAAGPWGAAIGAGLSIVSSVAGSLFGAHDEALSKEIEASKQRVKLINNLSESFKKALEDVLGGVFSYKEDAESSSKFYERTKDYVDKYNKAQEARDRKDRGESKLSDIFYISQANNISKETVDAINKANASGEYYDQQRALLLAQRDELTKQMNAEKDKKDSDQNAIDDYYNQIEALDAEIKTFAIDMAKALYGIDLKSWAQEFGDAIVSAWEAGEDASKAYANSVKSTMKKLAKSLLQQKIMEQAFKKSGIEDMIANMMDFTSGKLDYGNVEKIADTLQSMGTNVSEAYTAVLDKLYEKGVINKGDNESGLPSTIKGITESTADLLASYVNAIRLDVSVNRAMIAQYYPQFLGALTHGNTIANAQLTQLLQIANNTLRNADLAKDIYDILHSSQTGAKKLHTKS